MKGEYLDNIITENSCSYLKLKIVEEVQKYDVYYDFEQLHNKNILCSVDNKTLVVTITDLALVISSFYCDHKYKVERCNEWLKRCWLLN